MRRIAFCALLVLMVAGGATGQGTRRDGIVLNTQGRPVAGASVLVCTGAAQTPEPIPCSPTATIYSNLALTVAKLNPTTTDANGNYFYYANPGVVYKEQISGAGLLIKTTPDITIGGGGALLAVDVRNYGAIPNAINSTNFTSIVSSAVLNDTNAPWTLADAGKSIRIRRFDTGAVVFKGTILTVTSTSQLTLSGNVSYNCAVAGCIAVWGTNNATALQAAFTAAAALTSGVTLADLPGQESNYPLKLGLVKVTFPPDSRGSMYLFGTQLTVARKVDIDAGAMLFSNVGDGTASDRVWAINASPGAHITRLELDASFGMGVTLGTVNTQSHSYIGELYVWNAGTNTNGALTPVDQTAIQLLGYDFKVGQLWSKGGSIGTKLNISDYQIDGIYPIGAANNGVYGDFGLGSVDNILLDSVAGNGVFVNSGSDFTLPNIQAFGNVTALGYTVNVNAMTRGAITIHARNTGGKVIKIKGTADSTVSLTASNIAFGWETARVITELVEYSTGNSGYLNITGTYESGIASVSSGSQVGTLYLCISTSCKYYNALTATQFTSTIATGTAPHVVASTTKVANLNADLLDDLNTASAATPSTIAARDASADMTTRDYLGRRLKATGGTALVAGDFVLSAGWGAGSTVTAVTGTDMAWNITVTAAGVPGANPTVTVTDKDGTWTNVPIRMSKWNGGTGAAAFVQDAPTATTNVITFLALPVAGLTYILSGYTIGR